MADGHKIWIICEYCDGTGEMHSSQGETPGQVPCTYCDELGFHLWGWMSKEEYATMPDNLPGL